MHPSPSYALKDLYDHYETPTRKELGHAHAKFVRGTGNPEADIMFVGEAPGLEEDRQGKPFVGRAGQLLNKWLESIGLEREDVFISNVVKCHPMKNPKTPNARGNDRPPTPQEIKACLPILHEEIRIIQPRVIVALGSPATRTLLDTQETITQLHGRFHKSTVFHGAKIFPLYHPAALFHNPPLAKEVEKDMKALGAALEATFAAK